MQLDVLLEQLHSDAPKEHERAIRQILKQGKQGFAPEEGLMLLKASTLPYPPRQRVHRDTASDLVRAVLHVPHPEYLGPLLERFPRWSVSARQIAMAGLTRIEDERAAQTIMQLVRRYAPAGLLPGLPLGMYGIQPLYPEVFFPELFDYLELPKLAFSIGRFALGFASAQLIDSSVLLPKADVFLAEWERRRNWLLPRQKPLAENTAWCWKPRYHRVRWQSGILLDLLGYIPTPGVVQALRDVLEPFSDPRLQMLAALSLVRLDQPVEAELFAPLAANSECRKWVFDGLQKLERYPLYPADQRAQTALAESDLVNWLLHPAHLDTVPDAVEYLDTLTGEDREFGRVECHRFRFRAPEGHWAERQGWMLGLAGPYRMDETPTIHSLGLTGTLFESAERTTEAEQRAEAENEFREWLQREID